MAESMMDVAEKKAWGRARAATVLAVLFVTTQAASFHDDNLNDLRAVDGLHLAAWVCWAVLLCGFLAWSGAVLRGRELRAMMNDESTREHRRRAMALGFWGALAAALLVWVVSFFTPIAVREGVRLIVTCTIALALLRFGTLERRALKGE